MRERQNCIPKEATNYFYETSVFRVRRYTFQKTTEKVTTVGQNPKGTTNLFYETSVFLQDVQLLEYWRCWLSVFSSRGVFNRSLDILSTNSEQTDPGARLVDGEKLFTSPNVLSTSTRNPHGVKDNYIPTIIEQNPQYLVFGFEGIHLLQTLMRTFPLLFDRISGNCRNLLLPLRSSFNR